MRKQILKTLILSLLLVAGAASAASALTKTRYQSIEGAPVNLLDFGGLADYVTSATGATTDGSATLTDPSGSFTAADVGKEIDVKGAATTGVAISNVTAGNRAATAVWQVDDTNGVFVDLLAAYNDATANDTILYPASEAVDDYLAIGFDEEFPTNLRIDYTGGTPGVGGVVAWEYWNGAWTALSGVTDNTNSFTAAAGSYTVTFTVPGNALKRTLNRSIPLYYIRARITTTYSTNPVIDQGFMERVRITATAHGFGVGGGFGSTVTNKNIVGTTEANGTFVISVVDNDNFDLLGTVFTNTYVSGGTAHGVLNTTIQSVASATSVTLAANAGAAVANAKYAYGTDNRAALILAMAEATKKGQSLFVPAGKWKIKVVDNTGIAIPAGIEIFGEGRSSQLVFDGGVTTNTIGLVPADDVTLRDFRLTLIAERTNTAGNFMPMDANRLRLEKVLFEGAHTDSFVSRVSLIKLADANTTGLDLIGSEFSGWNYVLLKGNTDTGIQRLLNFSKNHFHDNYQDTLEFNSPLGAITDVSIVDNRFDTVTVVTSAGIHIGLQSVKNFVIAENTFLGSSSRAIQMEEDVQRGTITGNTIVQDGHGIWLAVNDNRTPSTHLAPSNIVIDGNFLEDSTGDQVSDGIKISDNDASGLTVLRSVVITNNVVRGYKRGIYVDRNIGLVVMEPTNISGNLFAGCTTGIRAENPSTGIRDNTMVNTTTAFFFVDGGLIGRHTFENVTTIATVTNGKLSILGWDTVQDRTLAATSVSTAVLLGDTPSEYDGFLNAVMHEAGTGNYVHKRAEPNWTGSVFTENAKNVHSAGVVTDSGLINSSGDLAWSLNNTGASRVVRIEASFEGLYTF